MRIDRRDATVDTEDRAKPRMESARSARIDCAVYERACSKLKALFASANNDRLQRRAKRCEKREFFTVCIDKQGHTYNALVVSRWVVGLDRMCASPSRCGDRDRSRTR